MAGVVNELHAQRPSATTRVSIRWRDGEPEERTSTLVLTSPAKLFVDLRIFKDTAAYANTGNLDRSGLGAIDWAFAGRATYGPENPDGASTCAWTHWVDSRTADAAAVHDAGISTRLPNGDTLEKGEMLNADGILLPYEEVWHDESVEPASAAVFVCFPDREVQAQISTADGDVGRLPFESVCGVVVRVGSWCQGILRDSSVHAGPEAVTVERWVRGADGSWTRTFRAGTGKLPCAYACAASLLSSPEELAVSFDENSFFWRCIELYEGGVC
ncbi:hypothetical protein M0805_004730 [Coniferiporia weirii]|nr:hypothetical protein M0805_004730 [Coniferiporia weirii]